MATTIQAASQSDHKNVIMIDSSDHPPGVHVFLLLLPRCCRPLPTNSLLKRRSPYPRISVVNITPGQHGYLLPLYVLKSPWGAWTASHRRLIDLSSSASYPGRASWGIRFETSEQPSMAR